MILQPQIRAHLKTLLAGRMAVRRYQTHEIDLQGKHGKEVSGPPTGSQEYNPFMVPKLFTEITTEEDGEEGALKLLDQLTDLQQGRKPRGGPETAIAAPMPEG